MKSFEEQFPSMKDKNIQTTFNGEKLYSEYIIKMNCLDKQKVRETINKKVNRLKTTFQQTERKPIICQCEWTELGHLKIAINELEDLLKELGL